MEISGEYRLPAPRERVWAALQDTEILWQSVPGTEALVPDSDSALTVSVLASVGPIKARFTGNVTLLERALPERFAVAIDADGGIVGHAKGTTNVTLADAAGATLARVKTVVEVEGKLAELAPGIVEQTARRLIDDVFTRFAAIVVAPPAQPPVAPPPRATTPAYVPPPAPVVVTPASLSGGTPAAAKANSSSPASTGTSEVLAAIAEPAAPKPEAPKLKLSMVGMVMGLLRFFGPVIGLGVLTAGLIWLMGL